MSSFGNIIVVLVVVETFPKPQRNVNKVIQIIVWEKRCLTDFIADANCLRGRIAFTLKKLKSG